MPQPPRFGIVRNQNLPWQTLVRHWQVFERLGFDSIWHADHYQRPSIPDAPFLEGWTLLAALALQTEKPRIGILVSSNTFRHPPLLAKQAVTVDHISGGRLELGIGTGWYKAEHERFGVPFPETPELVGRFEEAVMLIDALLTQDVTSWEGRYYQVHEAPFRPAPLQRPRPPITLGAHGPRMLRIAARYADRWNSYGTSEEIRERNDRLDEACAAIGRDPDRDHPLALRLDHPDGRRSLVLTRCLRRHRRPVPRGRHERVPDGSAARGAVPGHGADRGRSLAGASGQKALRRMSLTVPRPCDTVQRTRQAIERSAEARHDGEARTSP